METPTGRKPPEFIRMFADGIIYLAAALTVVGINFQDYFEARSEIAILRMKLELEKEKRALDPELEERLKTLESKAHDPNQ